MSRIYHNTPLASIPVNNIKWHTVWNESLHQKGNGVILEATITGRARYILEDTTGANKWHYFVLYVKVKRAHRRQYDASGKEMTPNFSETAKVRTGYLHSSYKTVDKGDSDALSEEEVASATYNSDLIKLTEKTNVPGCLTLWMSEQQLEGTELEEGDTVRLKTRGDGPFIESLAKLDVERSTVSNYAGGEEVGASWTDKVFAIKGLQDKPLPQDENEGVDDDEWDD